jgi:hypothetical protein
MWSMMTHPFPRLCNACFAQQGIGSPLFKNAQDFLDQPQLKSPACLVLDVHLPDLNGRLRNAVPKMILQLGGSISFAPAPGEEAHAANYDTRHKLCTLTPRPDQITVMCGSTLYDQTAIHPLDAFEGTLLTKLTHLHTQKVWAWRCI